MTMCHALADQQITTLQIEVRQLKEANAKLQDREKTLENELSVQTVRCARAFEELSTAKTRAAVIRITTIPWRATLRRRTGKLPRSSCT